MTTRTLAKLIVLSLAAVFALGAAETVVRFGCRSDEDGNVTFRSTRLMPYRVPVRSATKIVEQYLASTTSPLLYDAELGWSQRPGVASHNRDGFISVQPDVSRERPAEKLRIALFGGSYTQGSFEKGWWRVLENELNAAGVAAEVLNFGVGGYAMDQAYLRWKRDGAPYHPHVVLFGFAASNSYDNLNVVRMIKDPSTGIPFTKPRFMLEAGALKLLNSPTPPPEKMPALLADIENSGLVSRDWFYREAEFHPRWWRASRFVALLEAKTSRSGTHLPAEQFYRLEDEPAQLALAITRQFKADAEASGSVFLVAHLPYHTELEALKASKVFPFAGLYAELQRSTTVLPTEWAILNACAGAPAVKFFHDGHYDDTLQAAVGRALAKMIAPDAAEYLSAAARPAR